MFRVLFYIFIEINEFIGLVCYVIIVGFLL